MWRGIFGRRKVHEPFFGSGQGRSVVLLVNEGLLGEFTCAWMHFTIGVHCHGSRGTGAVCIPMQWRWEGSMGVK